MTIWMFLPTILNIIMRQVWRYRKYCVSECEESEKKQPVELLSRPNKYHRYI